MKYVAIGRAALRFPRDPFDAVVARAAGLGLEHLVDGETFAVFVDGATPRIPIEGGGGVVLGRAWSREEQPAPVELIDASIADPASLLREIWGAYVAFTVAPDKATVRVLRDPSGAVGCYRLSSRGLVILCSDLAVADALGVIEPHVDWGFIGPHIAYGGLRSIRTGLRSVREVLPGMAIALGQEDLGPTPVWTPAPFIASDQQILEPARAAHLLADEVKRCVGAMADAEKTLALELSGGLDSSILCAALADRAAVFAVNCATRRPEGDERRYAETVAQATGTSLTVVELQQAQMNLLSPAAKLLPRPGRSSGLDAIDQAFLKFGQSHRVSAFFSGGGGDNVFCSLRSAGPVVDQMRSQGLGPDVLQTALSVAKIHRTTLWSVLAQALKLARRPDAAMRPVLRDGFLRADGGLSPPDPHPWLDLPGLNLPGRYRHIHSLAWIHGLIEGHDRAAYAPMVFPLLAQPIVELCLRIPTWLWVEGGIDRAIARRAFRGQVPDLVLERRTKGRIDREIAGAFDAQRPALRDHLLGGLLAQNGVIDVEAVERFLRRPLKDSEAGITALVALADAETWARGWEAYRPPDYGRAD
ncbi:asparagine synthase C-terminal domain-containing protein [Caulobacter segnis]|uniref:asparagine synthase (glutamine-hydrolyzing) n=1 Tax=Caulobacter segnis TaxID=88688 RepID=A0A2W5V9Z8_9CAUL|nr:asparagine synthase C-terminal domain-containing protein [Caulobacter segnis]PZR35487.1 MAG: hypothetical protein DI526_06935 [Caulobacter segnis]